MGRATFPGKHMRHERATNNAHRRRSTPAVVARPLLNTDINISPFTEMEEVLERLESDCKKMAQVKDILKSMGLGEDDLVGKGSQKALPLYPLTVWSRILVARGAPGGFTNAARTIALLGARHGLDEEEVIYKRLRPLLPSDGQLRKEKQAGLRLPSYASAAGPPIAPLMTASSSYPFMTALSTSSFSTAAPFAPSTSSFRRPRLSRRQPLRF